MKIPDLKDVKPIKPVTRDIRKIPQCVFDIEIDKKNRTTVVGFYDGEDYYAFPNERAFLAHFLTPDYHGFVCWAHNGSGFDFQRLLRVLTEMAAEDENFRWKWLLNGGKLITGDVRQTVKINYQGKSRQKTYIWSFADSSLLYRSSLDALAKKILGHGKQGTFDTDNKAKLIEYNRIDCELLYGLIDKLEEASEILVFQIKPTAAACAFDYLRRQLPENIWIPTCEYFGRSYFGGRVLLIAPEFQGEGFSVDINSLYPWAMSQVLPTGKPQQINGPFSQAEAFDIINQSIGFAYCRVKLAPRSRS